MNVGRTFARKGFVTVTISYRLSALKKSFAIYITFFYTLILFLLSYLFIEFFSLEVNLLWPVVINLLLSIFLVYQLYMKQGEDHIKHPDHIEDVASAFKWVKENISRYGGDPESIFLMGHSAGGQLITLLVLQPKYLQHHNLSYNCIKGVIGLSGVYNFHRLHKQGPFFRWWFLNPLFGDTYDDKTLNEASPVLYAHETPFNFYLVYTSFDLHLREDAEELAEELKKRRVDVKLKMVKGTHLKSVSVIGAKGDLLSGELVEWCNQQLGLEQQNKKEISR